jgi:putative transposase
VVDDAEELLCFFDFPAEHWLHLKTSNPIESTFSPVRVNGPHLVALVRAGARFDKGVMVERPDEIQEAAA